MLPESVDPKNTLGVLVCEDKYNIRDSKALVFPCSQALTMVM